MIHRCREKVLKAMVRLPTSQKEDRKFKRDALLAMHDNARHILFFF